MSQEQTWLAFDLGAESGRAMCGRMASGVLTLEEIHRFPNEPVRYNGELHWDVLRLWLEMRRGLALAAQRSGRKLMGLGVDTWGVDYALLGPGGMLLGTPFHYRDRRTDGIMQRVLEKIPAEEVYEHTGIQFMPFNTLYQLYAEFLKTPSIFAVVEKFATIPDLLNFWLSGVAVCEFTNATTTQMYDPRAGRWSTELLTQLSLPTRIFGEIAQPGTVLGPLRADVAADAGLDSLPVIAPACHDTGSAVAAVTGAEKSAFISSGTWSLLGTEVLKPVISDNARKQNFTNEGGVCGTIRLLKNIAGLWLLQRCRSDWKLQGQEFTYAELCELARSKPALRSLVDPDHPWFVNPEKMPAAIDRFCQESEQPSPEDPAGYTRAILESLALKYRLTLEALETLTGERCAEVHIVGGGSQNALLNQFAADATGRRVVAGPVEATALGNIGMQMLATGAAASLAGVRKIIKRSFPVQVFDPSNPEPWEGAYVRFKQYCELSRRAA